MWRVLNDAKIQKKKHILTTNIKKLWRVFQMAFDEPELSAQCAIGTTVSRTFLFISVDAHIVIILSVDSP